MSTSPDTRAAVRLERLDAETRAAWQGMAQHPFAQPGFIDAWQRHSPLAPGTGVIAHRADGRLLAGAPAFAWEVHLDKVLGGWAGRISSWIAKIAPRYVHLPILCLGSPVADDCGIVVEPGLDAAGRARALDGFVAEAVSTADSMGMDLLIFKDVPDALAAEMHGTLSGSGFTRIESMPVAVLDLPFTSVDGYLSSLDGRLRSELRRKMRQSQEIRITVADKLEGDAAAAVDRLMAETWARRSVDFSGFDRLSSGFADTLLGAMDGSARCALTWHGDKVVGCNLFIEQGPLSMAFLIGLSGEHAREYNLYFVNWLWMVQHAAESGRKRLEFGQSNYALKQRLGCRLEPSWIYVRHRQGHWNALTRFLARRMSLPSLDPDLKEHVRSRAEEKSLA